MSDLSGTVEGIAAAGSMWRKRQRHTAKDKAASSFDGGEGEPPLKFQKKGSSSLSGLATKEKKALPHPPFTSSSKSLDSEKDQTIEALREQVEKLNLAATKRVEEMESEINGLKRENKKLLERNKNLRGNVDEKTEEGNEVKAELRKEKGIVRARTGELRMTKKENQVLKAQIRGLLHDNNAWFHLNQRLTTDSITGVSCEDVMSDIFKKVMAKHARKSGT